MNIVAGLETMFSTKLTRHPCATDPDVWVLLWSWRQNAFHVEPMPRMFEKNLDAFRENRRCDYVPLVVGEKELCQKMADHFREKLIERNA